MALALLPVRPEEQEEVTAFLARAFGMGPAAPFLSPGLIRWKYFEPRPGWNGTRSYALRQQGKIAAHGCAWPVTFVAPSGEVSSMRVIDWAGDPAAPGAGVLLFRKFADLAQTLLAVGGSAQTRAILPKIGFRQAGEMQVFAAPLRPWLQFRARPGRNWKDVARLARNWRWRAGLSVAAAPEWSAERVERFDGCLQTNLPGGCTPTRRDPERLNWILGCPGAVFEGYRILRHGEPEGAFLLARSGPQSRIADLWLDSGDTAGWQPACALAVRAALEDPAACEVTAVSSFGPLSRALRAVGLRARGSEPVFLYDPQGLLATAPPLYLQLVDGDECFLSNPADPFAT